MEVEIASETGPGPRLTGAAVSQGRSGVVAQGTAGHSGLAQLQGRRRWRQQPTGRGGPRPAPAGAVAARRADENVAETDHQGGSKAETVRRSEGHLELKQLGVDFNTTAVTRIEALIPSKTYVYA